MKTYSRIFVVFILLFFIEQSFASLLMSCDMPVGHQNDPDSHSKVHAGHSVELSQQDFHILKKPGSLPLCESEQSQCHCSSGTCSTVFLPTTESGLIPLAGTGLTQNLLTANSQTVSRFFRPPISI